MQRSDEIKTYEALVRTVHMEGHEFYCHEPAREGQLCSGWAMFTLAKDDDKFIDLPWEFSTDTGSVT
jgi:hypothetical protein